MESSDLFMGVLGPNYNVLAFRTRQTVQIDPTLGRYYYLDTTYFERELVNKLGETWEMNLAVAEKYWFALYRGLPRDSLTRAYP